jgi:hypothetical protein
MANSASKVAVIAVHGVGQHTAGASAGTVAELLIGHSDYTAPVTRPYSAFSLHMIDVFSRRAAATNQNTRHRKGVK